MKPLLGVLDLQRPPGLVFEILVLVEDDIRLHWVTDSCELAVFEQFEPLPVIPLHVFVGEVLYGLWGVYLSLVDTGDVLFPVKVLLGVF